MSRDNFSFSGSVRGGADACDVLVQRACRPEAIMLIDAACVALLLALQVGTLSAQRTASAVYDRVILGGHVMDPTSQLDAVRNIGLTGRSEERRVGKEWKYW